MSRARATGFTLLEVLIASVVGLVIVTSVMTFVLASDRAHQRRVRYAQLRRSAARVMGQLSAELRQAGHGVPVASSLESTTAAFPSRTLVSATTTSIGFIADLARPDSSLNGFSTLVDDQTTGMPGASVALLNELNGACDVSLGSVHCETGLSTLLLPRASGGCHDAATHPTCPWGLNRYRANEYVLVSDRTGRWVERQVAGGVSAASASRRALSLNAALPSALTGRARGGFLSSVDRVFYRDNGAGALERHQCWDTVGAPTLASLGTCVGGNGTAWEELAPLDPGSTLTFSYFDETGTAVAAPVPAASLSLVARVDVALRLVRTVSGEPLVFESTLSVSLRQ